MPDQDASDKEDLSPPARGVLGTPPLPLLPPNPRHDIMALVRGHRGKSGDRNTMIEPWVDVQQDLDEIMAGNGVVDIHHATVWIHGRLWGYHPETGRVYPKSGRGFISMNQAQYGALRVYARYNGINALSERELALSEHLSEDDIALARRVWRIREAELARRSTS